MLPEQNRLKKKTDFKKVFKKGKSYKNEYLFLKVVENNLNQSRFGFLLSKKNFKKSIQRNKIKRRLADLIRSELPEIKKGVDIVIVPKTGIERKDFNEIKKITNEIFYKAELIKSKL
jgi:ribonuclease P protein component